MQSPIKNLYGLEVNSTVGDRWQAASLCLKLGRLNQSLALAYSIVQQDVSQQQFYTEHSLKAIKLGAEFAEEVGDHAKAVFYWEQLTKQSPQSAEAWYGLGIAKANLQDYRGAEASLSQALRLEPQNQKVRQQLLTIQTYK